MRVQFQGVSGKELLPREPGPERGQQDKEGKRPKDRNCLPQGASAWEWHLSLPRAKGRPFVLTLCAAVG